MQSKTKTVWILEALIIDKETGKVKSRHQTTNTVTFEWEELVAEILSWSHVVWVPYPVDPLKFIDYMSIWAWFKLAWNSAWASSITLPYSPIDWNEDPTMYDWCTVYCISWPNQGESRAVSTFDPVTRLVTVDSPFPNVPLSGEVYVISTSVLEDQLQWEGEEDENGNTILNPKQPIDYITVKTSPNLNEVERRAEWVESEWDFIASECALRFNLATNTPGQSSTHTRPGKLFARATFGNNPPHKTMNDILQIRWTIRVWSERI